MTAVRDRLERAVAARLRESEQGRPRVEALGSLLRESAAAERIALSSAELAGHERWLSDRFFGLGELAPLLRDERVTEIMVNGMRGVWVERGGRIEPVPVRFRDADEILVLIERLVAPLGRRIDLANPLVDARLPDGSRVHAVIAPVALAGPILTIRRFSARPFDPDDLIRAGTAPEATIGYLVDAVAARRSMLISGGTSSGKTTTLNALAHGIAADERVVTIEDSAELRLPQTNVVALETRAPSVEGTGAIDMRLLLRNALRMRPDRIIVGEVRGGEALDMLQAMNTGHDGGLSTVHANSSRDGLARLETMVLMAGTDLPSRAVREQIVGMTSKRDLIAKKDAPAMKEQMESLTRTHRMFKGVVARPQG